MGTDRQMASVYIVLLLAAACVAQQTDNNQGHTAQQGAEPERSHIDSSHQASATETEKALFPDSANSFAATMAQKAVPVIMPAVAPHQQMMMAGRPAAPVAPAVMPAAAAAPVVPMAPMLPVLPMAPQGTLMMMMPMLLVMGSRKKSGNAGMQNPQMQACVTECMANGGTCDTSSS